MNKLLPSIEELKPYTNEHGTFYECGFNTDFNLLPFQQQLQVANDIVRQSILVNPVPNPKTHVENLEGDCYTAALASVEYLKYLNLGKNHRVVLCRRRAYDPEDVTTKHAAVLLEDENGETYFFDATPYVASKYGTVSKLENGKGFYDEFVEMEGDKFDILYFMKEFIYKSHNNLLKDEEIPFYLEIVTEAQQHPIFFGFVAKCYEILANRLKTNNPEEASRLIKKSIKYNPYTKLNPEFEIMKKRRVDMMERQIKLWQLELNDLLIHNKDYKRQLELAQNIYQEMKVMGLTPELFVTLDGQQRRMTNLTPRYFYENDLNIIMIKPSAYLIGVRATIRERFLKHGQGALFEYFMNLADPAYLTGIRPMIFSHTHGYEYMRPMDGPSDIILLKGDAEELCATKKILRRELGSRLRFQEVTWYDGKKIKWEPHVTNLVHSTDNPSEASMHFMIGYPEQQVMTRFMYPNPRLEKDEKELV